MGETVTTPPAAEAAPPADYWVCWQDTCTGRAARWRYPYPEAQARNRVRWANAQWPRRHHWLEPVRDADAGRERPSFWRLPPD